MPFVVYHGMLAYLLHFTCLQFWGLSPKQLNQPANEARPIICQVQYFQQFSRMLRMDTISGTIRYLNYSRIYSVSLSWKILQLYENMSNKLWTTVGGKTMQRISLGKMYYIVLLGNKMLLLITILQHSHSMCRIFKALHILWLPPVCYQEEGGLTWGYTVNVWHGITSSTF